MFKNELSAGKRKKEGRRKRQPKKDPILERGRKSVRTVKHVRHFPDLPFGEITIEGISFTKHCTTTTKKSPRIKMGWKKKKRREHCSKIELVLPQKEEGKQKQPKKDPILEREGKECTYLHDH